MSNVEQLADEYVEDPPESHVENRRRKRRLEEAIERADGAEDLRFIADRALWVHLPPEICDKIFERLIEFEPKNPRFLRQYGGHLSFHWPERDEEAAELIERAKELE